MIRTIMATTLALAGTLPAISAHAAARDRVFVASYGNDSNPCTFGSPCKTFQQAVNVVAEGGEVTAIDSAGFGPIAISHAVTITSPAGIEAGIVPVAGGDAIAINAGATDAVVLRGLTINGASGSSGSSGIVFNAGGSLTVSDCVVENFNYTGVGTDTGNGILMQPTSSPISFAITNTVLSNNGYAGIYYSSSLATTPQATGAIDHVVATNNYKGIEFFTQLGGGPTTVAISNSIANNNAFAGIQIQNGAPALTVSIDNTSVNSNGEGVTASNTPIVTLGRSVITGNNGGIINNTSPNTFYSYQDNRIDNNGATNILNAPNSLPLH